MFWFILALIVGAVAVISFVIAANTKSGVATLVGAVAAVLAVILGISASAYTQDEGDASVLRSFTGEVVGQDIDPGLAFKAPWVDVETFDIRNQMVAYIGDGTQAYNGQPANGPQITTADRDGVRLDFDLAINYSVNAEAITDIYRDFRTQDNFRQRLIEQDVRSIARIPFAQYTAQEALSNRGEISLAIETALRERWATRGVIIEAVALQEIRPPQQVMDSINEAQQARINVERETANLAAAEVQAQTRVAEATAQAEADIIAANANAEANRLLTQSLTPQVLQQRYLDTLQEVGAGGNLVVVPEGFNGLVNVSGQQ